MKRKETVENGGSVESVKRFGAANNYATQFRPGIRLEVPEPFRIYLLSDVISQRHGIARLCLCQRQMRNDDTGEMSVSVSDRAEMPKGKRL
jgi:hypothetical protein